MRTATKIFTVAFAMLASSHALSAEILNASYDVARELFQDVNPAFVTYWKKKTGEDVTIRQAHTGSSAQARAVSEGLQADVVTLNQVTDVQLLERSGLIASDWRTRLPTGASPCYSLPVFLVRAGNPKHVKDWDDLVKPGIQVVFPNPKTSGNGRYTYLAAYAYALNRYKGDESQAQAFAGKLLANVPVFDTGGRGASTTFVEREIGDVLVTFESEVSAIRNEYNKSQLQAVYPSLSLRADFPVAVVDKVVDKKGTRAVATAYLEFLFSAAGQEIIAAHHNRVRDAAVAKRHAAEFPNVRLVTVDDVFHGWDAVIAKHFAQGGVLDQLFAKAPAH
jgi:sulfate transport system substrate-binding protein